MGLTKINQILKKYKQAHKDHVASWDDAQKRIRAATKPGSLYPDEATYKNESYNYHLKGFQLFDKMIKELEGHEVFPKKNDGRKDLFTAKDIRKKLLKMNPQIIKGSKYTNPFLYDDTAKWYHELKG